MSTVLTAPLAVIKVNGVTIGKMKTVRVTEDYRRGRVAGIGELKASERPAMEFNGQGSCDFYTIDYESTSIPDIIKRRANSIEQFVDNVLLQEDGVDIVIFKKVSDGTDPVTGLIKSKLKQIAMIEGVFLNRDSMDIQEGQISGKSQEFVFNNPIVFNS